MNDRVSTGLTLLPPLRPRADLAPVWEDVSLPFDAAAERFVARHKADGDASDRAVMDLRTLALSPDDGWFSLRPLAEHEAPVRLRSNAFSALCARLGAPADFIRGLAQPVQLAVLNYLLARAEQPMPATLRLRSDEVTAIVSSRYAPLDAVELVDTLRGALARHGLLDSIQVRAVATGTTDILRLVLPSEAVHVKVGDVSMVGLDVSSSSFGKSAIRIRGLCFRVVCGNGMRVATPLGDLALRHVGDTQRLRDGLSDGVATALLSARGIMDHWKASVGSYITGLADYIQNMRELDQAEQQRVRVELGANKPDQLPERVPVYDFVNAVTQIAHDADVTRRIELESIAGGVLVDKTGGRS